MGAIEDIEGLCTSGPQAMWAAASAHAPLVVLAEGKTDTEFLEAGLRLLYPQCGMATQQPPGRRKSARRTRSGLRTQLIKRRSMWPPARLAPGSLRPAPHLAAVAIGLRCE
jgi:hypothetical protein